MRSSISDYTTKSSILKSQYTTSGGSFGVPYGGIGSQSSLSTAKPPTMMKYGKESDYFALSPNKSIMTTSNNNGNSNNNNNMIRRNHSFYSPGDHHMNGSYHQHHQINNNTSNNNNNNINGNNSLNGPLFYDGLSSNSSNGYDSSTMGHNLNMLRNINNLNAKHRIQSKTALRRVSKTMSEPYESF